MIGAFLCAGLIFLLRWATTKGILSLSTAMLFFIGAGILFIVKASESIERVEFRGYDPVGKMGKVTVVLDGSTTCSVRVDGMDWTARCKDPLLTGDEVVVVGREGVHLLVEKATSTVVSQAHKSIALA